MMFLSTDQPIGYPFIQHLASIAKEKTTESVSLNPPTKELLTPEDREELNFSDVCTFIHHVELAPREVYNLVIRLWKHLMLVDKQNQKLKSKFTNYKKANKAYVIDNVQLKAKNDNLENRLVDLKKQLENAWLDKRPTLFFSLLSASPPPAASVFDDLDDKSKHSHRSQYSRKIKSTKLSDLPILTDDYATGFDIDVWKSKMTKKLVTNADHYLTKVLHMTYVDSCMDGNVYKHLAARSRIGTRKLFAMAEKMFKVLQKTYGNSNCAHIAANKFRDLKMTGNFNSFWMEFQVVASELDHSKAMLIGKLKYKLTPLLSRAITGGVSWPKDIHEYVKQC